MGAMVEQKEKRVGEKKKNAVLGWVERVGKRNWIIVGAVLLIGLAVGLNWMLFAKESATCGYADYDSSSGMTSGSGQSEGTGGATSDADYFATVQINRRRARDESMEVLQSVIDSTDASETVKNDALSEMSIIAMEIEKEANIESLLISKGFEECVAVMNGNCINVVVKSEGELQPSQIAQINTVVYEQTGIEPLGVTIVHKN
jgi:hypothetical protein